MLHLKGAVDTVVSKPAFVRATTWSEENGKRFIHVYRSLLVEPTDEWLEPVHDLLGSSCFREEETREVPDRSMMSYRAISTVYRLWDECPGSVFVHSCRTERSYGA